MSYNFTNILEFEDFVVESFLRGNYTSYIENFKKGRNITFNKGRKWDWVESGKMYLVNNTYGSLYIIYRHPSPTFSNYLWYYHISTPLSEVIYGIRPTRYDNGKKRHKHDRLNRAWMGTGGSWVKEYLVLDSHSLTFMNWINENPLEVKQ